MKFWPLLLLSFALAAQEPTDREWQKYAARTHYEIVQFDLYQQPEGSEYPDWQVKPLYDSVMVLYTAKELVFGFRPTGGYATRWTRYNHKCPVSEHPTDRPNDSIQLYFPIPVDSCGWVTFQHETFFYTSTWSCHDPFCTNKHGHIQIRTETWIHPELGVLATRHSPYGRPNLLSFIATDDPDWMSKLQVLVDELQWEYTDRQRRKMKSSIGIRPEL